MTSNDIYTPVYPVYQDQERFDRFVQSNRDYHGDRFDYLPNGFTSPKAHFWVVCKEHNICYLTKAEPHRKKTHGSCPLCIEQEKHVKSFKKFQKRLEDKHGNQITVKFEDYPGKQGESMRMMCKDHGEFIHTPSSAVLYNGCKQCRSDTSSFDSFIEKSKEKYGDTFDYSLIDVDDSGLIPSIVELRCNIHDITFSIRRDVHLAQKNGGCEKCTTENYIRPHAIDFDEFVRRAKDVWGDRFEYFRESYETYKESKTEIRCLKHDVKFTVTPSNHVTNDYGGCPECLKEWRKSFGISCRTKINDFTKDCNRIHNNRYDYSKVVYENNHKKVEIICPDHGSFWQTPSDHKLGGYGCPTCGGYSFWGSKIYTTAEAYLYMMLIECKETGEEFFKIGVSINPIQRSKQIQIDTQNYYRVLPLHFVKGNALDVHEIESTLHKMLRDYKYKPRVKFGGWTECFSMERFSELSDMLVMYDDTDLVAL